MSKNQIKISLDDLQVETRNSKKKAAPPPKKKPPVKKPPTRPRPKKTVETRA